MTQPIQNIRTLKQTFIISADLSTNNTFNRNITLDFTPESVTLRQVIYNPVYDPTDEDNSDKGNFILNTSLLPSNSPLCIIGLDWEYSGRPDGNNIYPRMPKMFIAEPQTTNNINNFSNNSSYSFSVSDPFDSDNILNGTLILLLEFSKTEIINTHTPR